jgi:flagellar L-ring protein precursor FlgH
VRAHFLGDLPTVVIRRTRQGRKDASTTREHVDLCERRQFFGIRRRNSPKGFNRDIVTAETRGRATGGGRICRGSLTASITVRVDAVDSTGNLYVRGDKVVSVNREQEHILLTGLVRPEDIASDNSVLSSRLADARIDYYGRGVVGDKQNVPLVHRLFDWLWPF